MVLARELVREWALVQARELALVMVQVWVQVLALVWVQALALGLGRVWAKGSCKRRVRIRTQQKRRPAQREAMCTET